MRIIYIIILLVFSSYIYAQSGGFVLNQSPQIDSLMMRKLEKARKSNSYPGFRIQAYQGTQRSNANDIKKELILLYPDEEVILIYNEPHYKIRLGAFRTRIEAQQLLHELLQDERFKQSFIVPDRLPLPLN